MNEFACIRILFQAPGGARETEHLCGLIGRFTEHFLDQRWRLPRRYEPLARTCFLLIDPVAKNRDLKELAELANDLQMRLFGSSQQGAVQLFALWGAADEIAEFNAFSDRDLELFIANPGGHWLAGRMVRFGPATNGGVAATLVGGDEAAAADPAIRAAMSAFAASQSSSSALLSGAPAGAPVGARSTGRSAGGPTGATYRGVYFGPRSAFFGSIVAPTNDPAGRPSRLLETWRPPTGVDELEFDQQALRVAVAALAQDVPGVAYVPLSFSTVITRMRFERLRGELDRLVAFPRNRLAATLYGVPSSPPSGSLSLVVEALRGAFGVIDVQAPTPDFLCPAFVPNCARSITFVSQAKAPAKRAAEIEAFLQRLPEFKAAKLWVTVGQVQTPEELDLCLRLNAPFVFGPAVSEVHSQPFSLDAVAADRLPRRAA
ncbi:MAG: hypothetical protein AB1429_15380 [Pseudomonadota bacterium]|jgi:hypothetical protein